MAINYRSVNKSQEILILAVPFSEKDEARAKGARWNAALCQVDSPAGRHRAQDRAKAPQPH